MTRVLLIDDDDWFVEQMARMLTKSQFEVARSSNAIEAMEQIDLAHPDVIILDFFMPGPNGLVLLHELQSHSDLAAIPVILCTNSAADVAPEDLVQYGVRRVLDKTTMEPADVVAAIRKVTT
jgi:CheY-like chemotaxis protein